MKPFLSRFGYLAALLPFLAFSNARAQDHSGHSEHVGKETRDIKSLSEELVQALTNGEGAGYALPAELNHYPGPRHVLDLGEKLNLDENQRTQIQAIFAAMNSRAKELGHQLLELERKLDSEFQSGGMSSSVLEDLTGAASAVEGTLRFVHLNAHLETRKLLNPGQIQKYDELRGYEFGSEPD